MKKLLLIAFAALFPVAGHAAIRPFYQDIKLPTQQIIEKQSWAAPLAAASTYVVNAASGPNSAGASTITSFAHQPDFPRNLTITPAGSVGSVAGCTITIKGLDYFNHAISEDFVITSSQSSATTGSKAFRSVSEVDFPVNCETAGFLANWDVGIGTKLGLKNCMTDAGGLMHAAVDGVKEGTAPTMATAASSVFNNTAIFNTAPNGARNMDLYFLQNFQCVR